MYCKRGELKESTKSGKTAMLSVDFSNSLFRKYYLIVILMSRTPSFTFSLATIFSYLNICFPSKTILF